MGKLLKIVVVILVLGCINTVSAQVKGRKTGTTRTTKTTRPAARPTVNVKPLKGKFRVAEPDGSYTIAEIDLYAKTIDGYPAIEWDDASSEYVNVKGDGPVKVYGYIEVRIPGITDTYYIVGVDSAESPEPNMLIHGDKWNADMIPVRVAVDYDVRKQTITLTDWMGGDYFNNVTLKRVK